MNQNGENYFVYPIPWAPTYPYGVGKCPAGTVAGNIVAYLFSPPAKS